MTSKLTGLSTGVDKLVDIADEIGKRVAVSEGREADANGTWVQASMDALKEKN
ncbi:MAG TPA: hypothetical protein VD884_12355 [Ohtaekwangia sp.]|nr:hypothetical protein [Ohtaekwangia sp.]